jgi:hypothetical protein
MRGCWEPARAVPVTLFDDVVTSAPPAATTAPDRPAAGAADAGHGRPALDWVPVEDVGRPAPQPR